jgi:transposase
MTDGAIQQDSADLRHDDEERLALSEWLTAHAVTHVAMEATGVYWKPVWHVLDGHFDLVLANASHIKNVPGRKTDVNDAMWIADLLAHGLIRASFVPETRIQNLRDLTRTRKQLVRERASHVQRIDKILQDANLQLGSVLTDIMGKSGRAILAAIIAGETDPEKLVWHVTTRVKAPREEIVEALRGKVTSHHRFLLELHLGQADALEKAIDKIDEQVGERLETFRAAADRLTQIPGVSDVIAAAIVSEIGVDMTRFQTVAHLISWAGLCPRNDESAGKRRSNRLRHGAPWLKDPARAGRLVRDAREEHLPPGAVPPPQGQAWAEEGDHGGRRIDPHRRLPHAPRREGLRRPRRRPLREERPRQDCEPSAQAARRPGLRGPRRARPDGGVA